MPASTHVSRRRIAQGAAWAVPTLTLAAASPAAAASSTGVNCSDLLPVTLDWSNGSYVRTSSTKGTWTYTPTDANYAPLVVTITSRLNSNYEQYGDQARKINDNLSINSATDPGYLGLHQSPVYNDYKAGTGNGQTVTFSFSQPVKDLVVPIRDVDSNAYDFWDAIAYNSNGVAFSTTTNNANIVGGGSVSNPYRINNSNMPLYPGQGVITTRFAAPVSTFSVNYWNTTSAWDNTVDGDQGIFFADFTFNLTPKGC